MFAEYIYEMTFFNFYALIIKILFNLKTNNKKNIFESIAIQ